MTWICAASTFFGYGVLYPDVPVTLHDGTTKDLLQKAYPLSNFIAAGFAGSVRIGFMLLQSLADFLALPQEALNRFAWHPGWVATQWGPIAKSVFEQAPEEERVLGSRFLLVGVSPDEDAGFGAKVYFARFSEPYFRPGIMTRPHKFCSIGSGAGVSAYKRRLKPLLRVGSRIHQSEVGRQNGWAVEIGASLSRAVVNNPKDGISRHFHIIVVRRGSILIGNNDENIYSPNGSCLEIRMPPVAQSYAQFEAMAQAEKFKVAGAVC